MARTVREVTLANRTARLRLAVSTKPYWRALETGLHLGYRRRLDGGTWIARRRTDKGIYREGKLSIADDLQDADGGTVLDFSQAQQAARTWWKNELRVEQGLSIESTGPYTVARACADYLEDYRRRGGRAADTLDYAFRGHVLPVFGETLVAKLTARAIQDWHWRLAERPRRVRTQRGKSQKFRPLDLNNPELLRRRRASANRILTHFRSALNRAWRSGLVPLDDAWRRVKPFRAVDAPVIRYLTEDEITRLLNTCQGALHDLVLGALLTGCRYGELCRLTVADYNRDVGSLLVRFGKSGKARHVTLTEEGPELIERIATGRLPDDWLFQRDDGDPWKTAHVGRPMKEACQRVGIERASFHVLRHTHASHLAMRGVPMGVIAKQLGHADTRMTERHYAHLAPSYVAETIRKNFPRLAPPVQSVVVSMRASSGG